MSTTEAAPATAGDDPEPSRPSAPPRPPLLDLPDGRRGAPSELRLLLERAADRLPFLEKEMPIVAGLIRPGWTCIDVGAAGGTYTHLMSRAAGPTGRVHAVEPRARSMRYLRRFRAWLSWENVELHQLALTDAEGDAELQVPRFARTEAHLLGSAVSSGRTVRSEIVATTTLDGLVRTRGLASVELVKCDVEGAELHVLRGSEETLARFRPVLVVEVEARHLARYDSSPESVLGWLRERDYVPFRTVGGALVPVDGILHDENDYILLPRERLTGA